MQENRLAANPHLWTWSLLAGPGGLGVESDKLACVYLTGEEAGSERPRRLPRAHRWLQEARAATAGQEEPAGVGRNQVPRTWRKWRYCTCSSRSPRKRREGSGKAGGDPPAGQVSQDHPSKSCCGRPGRTELVGKGSPWQGPPTTVKGLSSPDSALGMEAAKVPGRGRGEGREGAERITALRQPRGVSVPELSPGLPPNTPRKQALLSGHLCPRA